jgi:hypothetical protein
MSRHVLFTSITTSALAINEQRGVVGFVYQHVGRVMGEWEG